MTIENIIQRILMFRDERNWKKFHNPKDLAISITLEATELLEVFQWSAKDMWCADKAEAIEEELADIIIYCVMFADVCGLNLNDVLEKKLERNKEKYPVQKCYGSKEKYSNIN